MAKQNSVAKYWLGDVGQDNSKLTAVEHASILKAVNNFVKIITNDSTIKVQYQTKGDDSYTNGKKITIGISRSLNDFDAIVGLALHEASHCLLSDFNFFKDKVFNPKLANLGLTPELIKVCRSLKDADVDPVFDDFNVYDDRELIAFNDRLSVQRSYFRNSVDYLEKLAQRYTHHVTLIKDLCNIIEDRRIDHYIMTNAPGYVGYYTALYNTYFFSKAIEKALQNKSKSKVNYDNYYFHIINIIHPKRDVNALPGLNDIYKLIDVQNISRLRDTADSFMLAVDVYVEILKLLKLYMEQPEPKKQNPKDSESDQSKPGSNQSSSNNDESDSEDENNNSEAKDEYSNDDHSNESKESESESEDSNAHVNVDEEDEEDEEEDDGAGAAAAAKALKEIRENQILEKAINAQKHFIRGNIKKTSTSKAEVLEIDALTQTNSSIETVTVESPNSYYKSSKNHKVVVIRGITSSLLESNVIKYNAFNVTESVEHSMKGKGYVATYNRIVQPAIELGTMLGRKLQTRQEERTLKTTRLNSGKIDRRLVAELGFGNERIFNNILNYTVEPIYIHLSLDASGSMYGQAWDNTMKTALAIAKAASMTKHIHVECSIRGTYDEDYPLLWVIYNSKTDSINQFKQLIPFIKPGAGTPEGLCYAAIKSEIIKSAKNNKAYLINCSDGEPIFNLYLGQEAIDHTKRVIDELKASSITVQSYFIANKSTERSSINFIKMYGKDCSVFINVNEINALAKSMNSMFERTLN